MRRRIAGGAIALVLATAGVASATPPMTPFDPATWTAGSAGFNQKMNCLAPLNCVTYTVMVNVVSVRGPEGAPAARPKVGERFYVRTQVALMTSPFAPVDTYGTRVLLPDGVAPAITSPDDVICAVTHSDNSTVRVPGPLECQDPVQVGLMWQFPAVSLDRDNVAQFWFPVVANRPVNGDVIQMLGQATANPLTLLPNPVLSEVQLFVDPATSGAAPAPVSVPGGGTGSRSTPLTGVVPVPGAGGVGIGWAAATAPGVTGYRVQVRLVRTTRWIIAGTTSAAKTTFRWRRATRGKRYQMRVAALINGSVGAWSKPITIRAR